jgi:hypothetical protein
LVRWPPFAADLLLVNGDLFFVWYLIFGGPLPIRRLALKNGSLLGFGGDLVRSRDLIIDSSPGIHHLIMPINHVNGHRPIDLHHTRRVVCTFGLQ